MADLIGAGENNLPRTRCVRSERLTKAPGAGVTEALASSWKAQGIDDQRDSAKLNLIRDGDGQTAWNLRDQKKAKSHS